ncbi:MAG TPA: hypothetical protein VHM28_05590 [Anaerolineales bacterium]|jgi:chromosome segregation ATPase|nr:hypothetical protein [Anaerolineales bacterium]
MEFEQVTKRLEWLDEQQRKNKTTLSDMEDRLASLETSVNALTKQIKTINKELNDVAPTAARIKQLDEMITSHRAELNKIVDAAEKRAVRREAETSRLINANIEGLAKQMTKINDALQPEDVSKRFKEHSLEEQRLRLAIQEMQTKVEEGVAQNKNITLAQKQTDEGRRQDAKRLTDTQGELASVRKRADEAREKTTLHSDNIRNLENRLTELLQTETARKESMSVFLDEQSAAQFDRDRAWKEWQDKYDVFKKQAETMEAQVTALDDTIRAAKRAQDAYNDLNQKLDRRIAEVSEMQRLAEDRVRQEWVAFKADEQKRWTGHSLSQDEAMRDLRKDMDKMEKRVITLDDTSQTMQDQLHQTTDTTEKQLQELMNLANEWLTAYERIMGHGKTKAKKTAK